MIRQSIYIIIIIIVDVIVCVQIIFYLFSFCLHCKINFCFFLHSIIYWLFILIVKHLGNVTFAVYKNRGKHHEIVSIRAAGH